MRKIALYEPLYVVIDQFIHRVQERQNLAVLLEEVYDGLIQTGERLVLLVLTRVVGRAAVEDIASTVTGLIDRQAALKRK